MGDFLKDEKIILIRVSMSKTDLDQEEYFNGSRTGVLCLLA